MSKHICINCKNEFDNSNKNAKFCSRKCYEEHRQSKKKKKKVICPICKEEFLQVRIGQKYCSNECKHKSTEDRIKCMCEHCGTIFERKKSEVDKNQKHYCSNDCRMSAMFWSKEDTNILTDNYKKKVVML